MSRHVLLESKTKILDSCQLCVPRIQNSVGDIMCLSNYYVALELLTAIYDCELICRKLIFISYIICHKLAVYYFSNSGVQSRTGCSVDYTGGRT
jgi:hypothetical protein